MRPRCPSIGPQSLLPDAQPPPDRPGPRGSRSGRSPKPARTRAGERPNRYRDRCPVDRPGTADRPGVPEPRGTRPPRGGAIAKPRTDDPGDPFALSAEEEQVVEQLRARDQEVRNHEEAHARVGGPYAGSPSYEYTVGPDNKRYAVSGSVPIDTSPVPDDPEATIQKMEVVKAAALAPAQPSGQDIKVAGIAEQRKQQASAELRALRQAEARGAVDATTGEPLARMAVGAYGMAAGLGGAASASTGPTRTSGDVTGLIGLVV